MMVYLCIRRVNNAMESLFCYCKVHTSRFQIPHNPMTDPFWSLLLPSPRVPLRCVSAKQAINSLTWVQMGVSEEQRGLLGSSGLILWRRRYFLLREHKCFRMRGSQGKFCSHAFPPPLTTLLNEQYHWCPKIHPVSLAASPQVTSWRKNCSYVAFFAISHSISAESKSRTWVLLAPL